MVNKDGEGKSHTVLFKLMKRADHCNKSLMTVPEGWNRTKTAQYKPQDMNIRSYLAKLMVSKNTLGNFKQASPL